MSFNCLIVDDEPLAISLIENHIAQVDQLTVVATCNSALKAFEIINGQDIDLMFLDIKMPSMTGLDFLKTIKNPPKTIFTTAYREFALDSYDLEVVDYLLKPITFERFIKAYDRFLREQKPVNSSEKQTTAQSSFLMLKSGIKHHRVSLSEIKYVESTKDYIQVHTANGETISAKYKISSIEEELPNEQFLRVHRSFIINKNMIKAFTIHDIDLGEVEIPIGASYKDVVLRFLDELKK